MNDRPPPDLALHLSDAWAFHHGQEVTLSGDPATYVIQCVEGDTVHLEPVWWWALLLAILSVLE